MPLTSPALTAAYESCLNEAFRQCPQLIQRWCAKVVEAMYERSMASADSAEKRVLQDAVAALKKNQPAIEEGFAAVLTRAITQDTQPAATPSGKTARSFSSLSFDDLELMGDNQVQETVESARLQQVVTLASESGLAGLSARLSTAQGFQAVKADRNPLRPEIMSQALLDVLKDLPAGNIARQRWLSHGAQPLGEELQALYVLLSDRLAGMGVAPAAYEVVSSPEVKKPRTAEGGRRGAEAGSAENHDGPDAAVVPGPDSLLTLDHLHRLLVGEYNASFKDGMLPSDFGETAHKGFAHTVPAAMDVLAELKEKGIAATREKKTRIKAPLPLAQMRAQLKAEAKSLGQSLAIEVVGLMIEQMANDPRLLAPVRQVISDAEPAFLRLGVNDPRFFSDKDHPARRLLENITARSLAYAREDAPGFAAFMEDLHEVAAGLTEEDASDAQHFADLLHTFETRISRHQTSNVASQGRAVQALLQAEQRNLLAEKIGSEIRARPDFVSGNRVITAFVTGPWAQVMAKERLLGEHGGEGSRKAVYSLALGDLLWSLDMAQAARHRKRLTAIIPGMLQTLREGLISIDYPLAHSKAFFDEMMVIHQAALRADTSSLDARAQDRRALEREFEERDHAGDKRTWLAPDEAQDSGFMADLDPDTKPAFESTQPQSRREDEEPLAARSHAIGETATLQLGAWVELIQDDKWVRAQLTWISPYNTLFLFTSEGGKTHSMTGPLLQYLLLQQMVKLVSQQGVLKGALDNVAREAMRNSMERSSRQ